MKIPNNDVDNFIKNPHQFIKSILLYGDNKSLIYERYDILVKNISDDIDPLFNIIKIDFTNIKENFTHIEILANTISLNQNINIIRIDNFPNSIPKEIINILSNVKTKNIIIALTDNLSSSSTTRKFFEESKLAASIACYNDSESSIRKYIKGYIENNGYSIDIESLEFLKSNLPNNRDVIKSELDKLILYLIEDRIINIIKIKNCNINHIESDIDIFCQLFSERNNKYINLFDSLLNKNENIINIIRILIRYMIRLLQVKSAIIKNIDIDESIKLLSPPLFFNKIDSFKKALSLWNRKNLTIAIDKLIHLEIKCKTLSNHNIIAEKTLIDIIKL